MSAAILVLVEHLKGAGADITFEMLGAARKLAGSLGGPVHAVLVGKDVSALAARLGAADSVLVADDPSLEQPSAEVVLALLKQFMEQKQASLVLLGGTNVSFGLGARLSARTKLPFVNFCKGARVEDSAIVLTSQLFGGKILSDVKLADGKGIISVMPGAFPADAGKSDRAPTVEKVVLPAVEAKVAFKRFVEPAGGDVDITKQEVLVSVGRGIQNAANVSLAEDLAKALGGAVSASRPVVDQGWMPLTRQVGKSGMTVKPKLYLALGISGAPEHLEGMKDAPLIIAVNTDPKAPIFDFAHYGANVDCLELIEPLTAAVQTKKAGK
jgi:electron transfer flavoprotein alpha subunit